jgi:hypothetical protein
VDAVRRSQVLLALIHSEWLDVPDPRRPGRRALTNPDDWVRRELEVAFASGVLVVPVFLGRRLEQLDARRLPRSLAQLAECQYVRFGQRSRVTDLTEIGDRLSRQVPALAALDRRPSADAAQDAAPVAGQSGGIGSVQGEVGTFVQNAHGPLHTGPGDQINGTQVNGTQVNGDGTFVGGSQSGFTLNFGSRPRPQDGER